MESLDNIVERIFQAHKSSDPVGALHTARKLLDAHIKAWIQRAEAQTFNTGLRDQFAGLAMQGLLASHPVGRAVFSEPNARRAYEMADAMLAERERSTFINAAVEETRNA